MLWFWAKYAKRKTLNQPSRYSLSNCLSACLSICLCFCLPACLYERLDLRKYKSHSH